MQQFRHFFNQSNHFIFRATQSRHFTTSLPSLSSKSSANRLEGLRPSVWVEFTQMVAKFKPVSNLGQGFPDFDPPKFLLDSLHKAALDPSAHQYPLSKGHTPLLEAIARYYSPLYKRELNPNSNISVSNGAYGCLYATSQAFVNPGDEVVIIEPFYDCYINQVMLGGGHLKFVPLRATKADPKTSQDWAIDPDELAKAFTNKTKLLIINNPNNPLGKVYSKPELKVVADLCQKYDTICVSDEVYEFNTFDGLPHERMATLDGMWERTLTTHSAGKIFSVTGWKTGWTIGPKDLLDSIAVIHSSSLYCTVRPTQIALAEGFERESSLVNDPTRSYIEELRNYLQDRRDELCSGLKSVGIVPITPSGTYFLLGNMDIFGTPFTPGKFGSGTRDYQLARWMYEEVGVGVIPPSAFYSEPHSHLADRFMRFSFARTPESIDKAINAIRKYNQ
ncbi:tyrosine aminotransferase [Oopsacas minuta]|uniref:Tyrosine aminotransferase n=1 Tax=Oopsacas minuta TaxID=111878 RepID=A0AAV7JL86_9METZ|nr:tyrosine aminotransferase [Oopsacas minuta]